MARNMTEGSITEELVKFCVPLIFSVFFQQMFNWTDSIVLGNVEGENALASVGVTVPLSEFLITLTNGFTVGLAILVAKLYGNGKKKEIQSLLSFFTIFIGILFSTIGVICAFRGEELLKWLQTPSDIIQDAVVYLQIILFGVPCLAIYNVYTAVLRGIGDSRIPFLTVVFSICINYALDILLVYFWRFGIMGAACATFISQFFMMLFISLYTNYKYKNIKLSWITIRGKRNLIKQGFLLGIPTALQSSIAAGGNLLLQNFMNGFGVSVVTAITTAYRIDGIIMLPIINLGTAISMVVSQNIGAEKEKRAEKGFKSGVGVMCIISIFLIIIVRRISGLAISLFGVVGEAKRIGQNFFDIISSFYFFYGMAICGKSYLEGRGNVIFTGIVCTLSLFVRIAISYGTKSVLSYKSIALAEGISWVAMLIMYAIRLRYLSKCRKKQKIV